MQSDQTQITIIVTAGIFLDTCWCHSPFPWPQQLQVKNRDSHKNTSNRSSSVVCKQILYSSSHQWWQFFVLYLHLAMKSLERILINSYKRCCEIKENTDDRSCHSCLSQCPLSLSPLLCILTFHTPQQSYMREQSLLWIYNRPLLSQKPATSYHEERYRVTRNLPF